MGCSKLRGKFIANKFYLQKQGKSPINNSTPRATGERTTNKAQSEQKDSIKIRVEINDIETKKQQKKISETKKKKRTKTKTQNQNKKTFKIQKST